MRDFPKQHLEEIEVALIGCYLTRDKGGEFRIEYHLTLHPPPFLLHEEEATEINRHEISLSGLPLNGSRDWRGISGKYKYGPDEIEGSFRARNQWFPVDLPYLQIQYLEGTRFQIDGELTFCMECWDDCYRDFTMFISTEAAFTGYHSQVNTIGSDGDFSSLESTQAFLGKYLDVGSYTNLACDGTFITMDPVDVE